MRDPLLSAPSSSSSSDIGCGRSRMALWCLNLRNRIDLRTIKWIAVTACVLFLLVQWRKQAALTQGLANDVRILSERANAHPVLNAHRFKLEKDFIPIVVYVHSRQEYYRQVLEGLRKIAGIEKTMLIVSHDAVDPGMYRISESIDFMQVRILTHTLPRTEPASHFRLKKHWLWFVGQVFDNFFPDYQGDVAFFEEDHLISQDAYQVIKVTSAIKAAGIVPASVTTLGSPNLDWNTSDAEFIAHRVNKDKLVLNAGYAFNRSVWTMVKAHMFEFMHEFNKNWDCALADMMKKYPAMGDLQITALLGRLQNIGIDGIHDDQEWANLARDGLMPYSKLSSLAPSWYPRITLFDLTASPRRLVCTGPDCYRDSPLAASYCLPDAEGNRPCQ